MEAYSCALCQLRALLYLAQRLLHDNSHGNLFFQDENGLSQLFLQEYASMHKGCFYGRCVGFQVCIVFIELVYEYAAYMETKQNLPGANSVC